MQSSVLVQIGAFTGGGGRGRRSPAEGVGRGVQRWRGLGAEFSGGVPVRGLGAAAWTWAGARLPRLDCAVSSLPASAARTSPPQERRQRHPRYSIPLLSPLFFHFFSDENRARVSSMVDLLCSKCACIEDVEQCCPLNHVRMLVDELYFDNVVHETMLGCRTDCKFLFCF